MKKVKKVKEGGGKRERGKREEKEGNKKGNKNEN